MTKRSIQLLHKKITKMHDNGQKLVAIVRVRKNHRLLPVDKNFEITLNESNVELVGVYDSDAKIEWIEEDMEQCDE